MIVSVCDFEKLLILSSKEDPGYSELSFNGWALRHFDALIQAVLLAAHQFKASVPLVVNLFIVILASTAVSFIIGGLLNNQTVFLCPDDLAMLCALCIF
jgi:hypothetical protein